MTRISYKGKLYTLANIDNLNLDDLIQIEDATGLTMLDLEKLEPRSARAVSVGMFATLRAAGDESSYADACKIRLVDIIEVPEPEDRKPAPKAKSKPRKAATASGPDARALRRVDVTYSETG